MKGDLSELGSSPHGEYSNLRSLKCYSRELKTIPVYCFETLPKNLLFDTKKMYLESQQMETTPRNHPCPH